MGLGRSVFEKTFGMSGVHLKGKCLECGRLFDKVFASVGCIAWSHAEFAFLIGGRGVWDRLRIISVSDVELQVQLQSWL